MAQDIAHVWVSKDTLPFELQFLQPLDAANPQSARVMVGPRQWALISDPSNQTAAISAAALLSFTPNNIIAGSWTPPAAGIGIVWENFRAIITATDASGKLQLTPPLVLGTSYYTSAQLAPISATMPFTFPPINNAFFQWQMAVPTIPYLPTDGTFPNGPLVQVGLINTDGAATHTYKRTMIYGYRYIYDVDYSKERVYVMGTLP